MPNALRYTDIFGLEVYKRMQKLENIGSQIDMRTHASIGTRTSLATVRR